MPEVLEALVDTADSTSVHAHGDTLTVHVAGAHDGPALLLVHGLEGGWAGWSPIMDELGKHYRLYIADLPWRAGGTYRWRSASSPAMWLDLAVDLMDQVPAAVLAHSFGANATLQWLSGLSPARAPQAAVLLSPFYRTETTEDTWCNFERAKSDFHEVMAAGLQAVLGSRGAEIEKPVLDGMVDAMLERIGTRGFITFYEQFLCSRDIPLANIGVSTLVVAGTYDPGIRAEHSTELLRALPQGRLFQSTDFGHFCHLEQPEQVSALVLDHLASTLALDNSTFRPTAWRIP